MHHARRLIVVLSAVLALAPFAAIMATALVAAALGCQLNEAAPAPCYAFGTDIGGLMTGFLVTGGLVQVTIPILIAILALWALIEGIAWLWRRIRGRRRRMAEAS